VELIVTVGERTERVRVERRAEVLRVQVGERWYEVDQAAIAPNRWTLLADGQQFEVAVLPRGPGRWWVSSSRAGVLAEVTDPLTHLASQGAGGKGARRREQVTAYMPGRVVSVLVAAGDEVQPGQGVLVLEAMKMQNEIQAEHAGTIKRVCVAPGQAVEGGDLLFELE
jgi:acetyl-CoA/propionyl-CoA carboxylase biotin carboxyl carrier protein